MIYILLGDDPDAYGGEKAYGYSFDRQVIEAEALKRNIEKYQKDALEKEKSFPPNQGCTVKKFEETRQSFWVDELAELREK